MKWKAALLGICVVLATGAYAQETPSATANVSPEFALNQPLPAFSFAHTAAAIAAPDPEAAIPADPAPAAAKPQGVYGVYQQYPWQINAGYTFSRFYYLPGHTLNLNGANLGVTYYPGARWVGADGQLLGLFGTTVFGDGSKLAAAMGGPRFRWAGPRNLEIWGHVLAGYGHEVPRIAGHSETAFAYEAGGGVDLNVHRNRLAYRAEADMLATRFFGTHQYSPQVSVGIVFKF